MSESPAAASATHDARVDSRADALLDPVKPRLRGWLHAGMAPIAVVLGIVLVVLSPPQYRWAAALYSATAIMLFGTSALYHRVDWSPEVKVRLKRLDHAHIFLIIAGSYTPFAVAGLGGDLLLPAFWEAGGPAVVILLALGGLAYSAGGVVYALKRPNPSPTWFGFHEVFHALTLAGFLLQYVAVSMVLYGAS